MATPYARARPRSETSLRAEELLGRYPNLSEQELAELINLFPYLDIISHGLMAADDRMAGKLGEFRRDHGARLGSGPISPWTALVFPAILAAYVVWYALS